jgi:hypothetical protein
MRFIGRIIVSQINRLDYSPLAAFALGSLAAAGAVGFLIGAWWY